MIDSSVVQVDVIRGALVRRSHSIVARASAWWASRRLKNATQADASTKTLVTPTTRSGIAASWSTGPQDRQRNPPRAECSRSTGSFAFAEPRHASLPRQGRLRLLLPPGTCGAPVALSLPDCCSCTVGYHACRAKATVLSGAITSMWRNSYLVPCACASHSPQNRSPSPSAVTKRS